MDDAIFNDLLKSIKDIVKHARGEAIQGVTVTELEVDIKQGFPYKPLPNGITIKKSSIHGLGLFSTELILEGTELGLILIADPFTAVRGSLDLPQYIRTPLGGFGNHSDSPNCIKFHRDKGWYIKTIKDIPPDQEITWTYTLYKPK